MRVLPDVVGARPRRRPSGAVLALLAMLLAAPALAGCSQFDAALGQRQAIVTFRPDTSVSQKLTVRSTCGKVPAVTPQPLPPDLNSPSALPQVTFQIDHASDTDVARLETCLAKFPSVVGVTLQDSSDDGG
jgi:hypothetical protein